jgi:hypothetical protein
MSLTNGLLIYVAEQEAFFEGSLIYGVQPHIVAMAEPGSDRVLSAAGIRALQRAKRAQSRATT